MKILSGPILAFALPLISLLTVAAGCSPGNGTAASDPVAETDPFIGTDFTGNTYPGAQAPFGMVQLSPDNGLPGWDRISGYFYPDSTIAGFSHTHLSGTGAGDLYDISFMPVTLPAREAEAPLGIHSRFSHDSESARAGYYKVTLSDYGIDVELTATPRVGLQRYTFTRPDSAAVILNLAKAMNWDATRDSRITVIDSVTIVGYRFSDGWARNQKVWFATRFSRPFTQADIDTVALYADGIYTGRGETATFRFNTSQGESITLATALSPTGTEAALANLRAESPEPDFDRAEAATRKAWNELLGRISVSTDDPRRRKIFYTALYHALIAPTIFCDADGSYPGPDGRIHKAAGWTNYSTFSTWDTYRAAHPLYTIVDPGKAGDMARSLLEFGIQNGRLPVWNLWGSETDMMIGYHSAPIIADAIIKGLGNLDARKALDLMVATARKRDYRQLGDFIDLGYVPVREGDNWQVSKTLEYAFDDYSIAMLAKRLGDKKIYEEFLKRSKNYANTYNPATGFFQNRLPDGRFVAPFNPDAYTEDICESNSWQYLFSVQHDVEGMISLFGGPDALEAKLDSMTTHKTDPSVKLPIFATGMIGQYAHGNEPAHHYPYLYNYTSSPWKGADWLYRIMTELYTDNPSGLPGNEDMGQMSAWYVLSSLGFYPLNPVGGVYELGTPLFDHSEIRLPGGKKFTIRAIGLTDEKRYIAKAKLNGKTLDAPRITHEQIMAGGTLELQMTSRKTNHWKKH